MDQANAPILYTVARLPSIPVNELPVVKREAFYHVGVKRIALRFGYEAEPITLAKACGAR
ncbi:MAG: hypothetical protein ACK4L7_10420 [Flavobacteriales bacterium]